MSSKISTNNLPPPPPPPKPKYQQNNDGGNVENHHYSERNFKNQINGNSHSSSGYQNGNHRSLGKNNFIPASPLLSQKKGEQVVMTPRGKTSNSTTILIERKLVNDINDHRVHVAGGDHTGIIINKETLKDHKSNKYPADLMLEFRVFLVSSNTGKHSQESRTLRFWFRDYIRNDDKQAYVAQEFFKDLVSPKEFPRDYVGFIKKIMKLLQKGYDEIHSLEVEMKILEETSAPPSRPLSIEESQFEVPPLTQEKVLELIEQAYPNPITPDDLAKDYGWIEQDVLLVIISLKNRGLIKPMQYNSYTRIHHEDKDIQVVKQMPTISSNKQPTIAIITAQYCEKVAVDAMLENKETFVRYTTVGESNVYTLGNIGAHRIVSTKLPSIGSTREAMTAAGNATTRLLGTFQKVDFVFIVGIAGGIPHYTDYKKHVRLGDVVISDIADNVYGNNNTSNKPFVYVCSTGEEEKKFYPANDSLQKIAENLCADKLGKRPWESYLKEGILNLQMKAIESDFNRPHPNTDKLYMNIGNHEVIEVAHPLPATDDQIDGVPSIRLHLGPIGSGRDLIRSDNLRTAFARKHDLLATDVEMGSVLESIIGNCKDGFIVVKGISDYKDGLTTKKWQNYSSLAAAAVMKSIICGMDAPTNV